MVLDWPASMNFTGCAGTSFDGMMAGGDTASLGKPCCVSIALGKFDKTASIPDVRFKDSEGFDSGGVIASITGSTTGGVTARVAGASRASGVSITLSSVAGVSKAGSKVVGGSSFASVVESDANSINSIGLVE